MKSAVRGDGTKPPRARGRPWYWVALGVVLGVIALLTLRPTDANVVTNAAWCLICPLLSVRDIVLNVALFVPLGWCLARLRISMSRVVMVGAALSLAIEILQWLVIPGRDASLLDIITNTMGAAIGGWMAPRVRQAIAPSRASARALAIGWATAWAVQLAVTSWSLAPDFPDARLYWGQWAHVFPTTVPFSGTVRSFRVNSLPIPDDSLAHQAALYSSLEAHGIHARLEIVQGHDVAGRAQIAGLVDGKGNLLIGMMQDGCDYRFIVRMRGERLGLNAPTALFAGDCSHAGEPTTLEGDASRRGLTLTLIRGPFSESAGAVLGVTSGWTLLAPFDRMLRWERSLSAIWALAWALPLAWWMARSGFPRRLAGGLYWSTMLGLALLTSKVSGLAGPGIPEIVGMVLASWPLFRDPRPLSGAGAWA